MIFPSLISPREDNTQGGDIQQDSKPSLGKPVLGVPLTGKLLFDTSWIVGLGISKAVYAYHGQSLISPTLDWVGGTLLGLS
jgi:hypothetical protein